MKYFLDTYALIEIIKGNPSYIRFREHDLFTSLLNLYELYYILLREKGEDEAKKYFSEFYEIIIPIKESNIFFASKFKLNHKNISYADALGYAIAYESNMKFLTGDQEFKNIENVEFVK